MGRTRSTCRSNPGSRILPAGKLLPATRAATESLKKKPGVAGLFRACALYPARSILRSLFRGGSFRLQHGLAIDPDRSSVRTPRVGPAFARPFAGLFDDHRI